MTWQVGDTIPLQLYVPDGDVTTGATVTYSATDSVGTVLTSGTVSPAPSTPDTGKTWNTEKVATVGGTWTFKWTVTGTGAGVEVLTQYVSDTPPVPWVPTLREVADFVPSRTVPVNTPADDPKMIFDGSTRPTGEQVYRLIRAAVGWVSATVGTVHPSLYAYAQSVAALRTAGTIELAYPERDNDVPNSVELLSQADKALEKLEAANESASGTSPDVEAQYELSWSFPDPDLTEDPIPQRTSDWGGMSRLGRSW
jgi:hypothetical protein